MRQERSGRRGRIRRPSHQDTGEQGRALAVFRSPRVRALVMLGFQAPRTTLSRSTSSGTTRCREKQLPAPPTRLAKASEKARVKSPPAADGRAKAGAAKASAPAKSAAKKAPSKKAPAAAKAPTKHRRVEGQDGRRRRSRQERAKRRPRPSARSFWPSSANSCSTRGPPTSNRRRPSRPKPTRSRWSTSRATSSSTRRGERAVPPTSIARWTSTCRPRPEPRCSR